MSKSLQNLIAVAAALIFATSAISGAVAPAMATPEQQVAA